MNALEKYASKQKLAMGLMNSLGSLMGKLGGPGLGQRSPQRNDDAQMLCKVLDSTAAQAIALKKKIAMGHKLPSWAEYKVYKAGDAIKSAMASTYSLCPQMPRISIAIKSVPSMGSAGVPSMLSGLKPGL
jgi:hypothetical protein